MSRPPVPKPFPRGVPLTPADFAAAGLSWRSSDFGGMQKPTNGVRVTPETTIDLETMARSLLERDPDIAFSHHTGAEILGLALPRRLTYEALRPLEGQEIPEWLLHYVHPGDPGRPRRFLPESDRRLLHVAVPRDAGNGTTRDSRRYRYPRGRLLMIHGIPVLSIGRLACTIAPETTECEMVQMLDSSVNRWTGSPLTSIDELRMELAGLGRAKNASRVLRLLDRVDARSASPQESLLRLIILNSGLPVPELNVEVAHRDQFGSAVIADFFFREAGAVLEYDGDQHRHDKAQWRRDKWRDQVFSALGLRYMHVTDDDLKRPDLLIYRIACFLAA